jgi:hypothetical protein
MDFWSQVMKDKPIEQFPVPGNIVFMPVDGGGMPASGGIQGARMEAFRAGTEPRAAAPPAVSEP